MRWSIKNFKGISNASLDIQEEKFSVITGVNSSGKSSIIQSLLLAAQSAYSGEAIVLNGPLVRLGDPNDLVREASGQNHIELEVDLDPVHSPDAVEIGQLKARYELSPDENTGLSPTTIELAEEGCEGRSLVVSAVRSRKNDVDLARQAMNSVGAHQILHLKSLIKSSNRQLRTYVIVKGLQPHYVFQALDQAEAAKRYKRAFDNYMSERKTADKKYTDFVNRPSKFAIFREFANLVAESHQEISDHAEEVRKFVSDMRKSKPYMFEKSWGELSDDSRQALIDIAAAQRSKRPYIVTPIGYADRWYSAPSRAGNRVGILEAILEQSLGDSFHALNALDETMFSIANRVQYLGPLRDEPRVVWNHWNELTRGLPVGTRGEYSAAILSRDNQKMIRYVNPQSLEKVASLGQAVNDWLTYLEIGDSVSARSHGKLGVGLDLDVSGSIRDLTSVGVGVSQALPLLVGLLSTPRGAVFIVEQPELHLHPAVQARLADFMLTARPDLTVLVETHSDSFVTRVRRRVAENQFNPAKIDIVFVEPSVEGANARSLKISEFGNLSDWPDGFLSSTEEDVRAILMANVTRNQKAGHNV